MSGHTPEPWIEAGPSYGKPKMVEVTEIVSVYGETEEDESETICEFPSYIDKGVRAANARRIVACVNACKGIPLEVLEAPGYSVKAELDTLDEQIKGRLEANKQAFDRVAKVFSKGESTTLEDFRAAIFGE